MTGENRPARIVKRSVTIAGHSTSISLEHPFWNGLVQIARSEGLSAAALLRKIDAKRTEDGESQANLSSAVRIFVLEWLAARAEMDLRPNPAGRAPSTAREQGSGDRTASR
jgi:predicted DNA-binding ribbon-helix-helix protein